MKKEENQNGGSGGTLTGESREGGGEGRGGEGTVGPGQFGLAVAAGRTSGHAEEEGDEGEEGDREEEEEHFSAEKKCY